MDAEGPSDELQEVEEELVNKKSEEHVANDDEEDDIEVASQAKAKKPAASGWCLMGMRADNLKVFTQVHNQCRWFPHLFLVSLCAFYASHTLFCGVLGLHVDFPRRMG
jgi:hypothetical protein